MIDADTEILGKENPAYLRRIRKRLMQIKFSEDNIVGCFFGESCGVGIHYVMNDTSTLLFSPKEEKFDQYLRKLNFGVHVDTGGKDRKIWRSSSTNFDEILIDELCLPVQETIRRFLGSNRIDRFHSSIKVDVEDRTLLDDGESIIEQKFFRVLGEIVVLKSKGRSTVSIQELCGGQMNIDDFLNHFEEAISRARNRATLLLDARRPQKGEKTVILSPELTGLFVHEALGHAAEGDTAVAGSFLSKEKGNRVASEQVTVVDNPSLPFGNGSHGFDDEGIPATPTKIVEKGILENFLHNTKTAEIMDDIPTSNSRCCSHEYIPLIRMTNTYAMPGEWKFNELIEDTKEGYLLEGFYGAPQTTPSGDFVIKSALARPICQGEIEDISLGRIVIIGKAKHFLQNVDAMTSDFFVFPHTCLKEQPAEVGMGGPFIRTKVHIGED
jgi:predicted Zn-dependent protease